MSRIDTILVPVDFGDASDHALRCAVDLAEQLGAKIVVMTAYETPSSLNTPGFAPSAELAKKLGDATQAALDRTVAPYRDREVPLEVTIEPGDPRDAILDAAARTKASLIVMGTHGRRGIARALLGSVAESIVRVADVPVLTVR